MFVSEAGGVWCRWESDPGGARLVLKQPGPGLVRREWHLFSEPLMKQIFVWASADNPENWTCGFVYGPTSSAFMYYGLRVPFWLPVLVTAALPAFRAAVFAGRRRRRRRRQKCGLCLVCGYDLRASVDRCPECGTTIRLANHKSASP